MSDQRNAVLGLAYMAVLVGTFVLAWILTGGDILWTYRVVLLQAVIQIGMSVTTYD